MKITELGMLESVELREVWKDETKDFSPWVAENFTMLNTLLTMQLELTEIEKNVGSFSADIFCLDKHSGTNVVIENQLEKTDHDHLGKMITYAAGLDVSTVIWIARNFRDEHRAVLDWLNQTTGDDISYFGLNVELWRIGESLIAPKFNIVAQPNNWMRSIPKGERRTPLSETELLYRDFWNALRGHFRQSDTALVPGDSKHADLLEFRLLPKNYKLLHAREFVLRARLDVPRQSFCVEVAFNGRKNNAALSHHWFDACKAEMIGIENELGFPLSCDQPINNVQVNFRHVRTDVEIHNQQNWPDYFEWMQTHLEKLDKVFRPRAQAFAEQYGE